MSATDQISALNARYQVPVTNIWPVASAIAGSVTLTPPDIVAHSIVITGRHYESRTSRSDEYAT